MNLSRPWEMTAAVDRLFKRFGPQLAAEEKIARDAEHSIAVRELSELTERGAASVVALQPAVDKAQADCHKAKIALDAAQAKLTAAAGAYAAARAAFSNHRTRLELACHRLADPRIEEAKHGINTRLEKMRLSGFRSAGAADDTKNVGWSASKIPAHASNQHAFKTIHAAARDAGRALDRLKLTSVNDVEAAIAEIEASIPWHELEVLR